MSLHIIIIITIAINRTKMEYDIIDHSHCYFLLLDMIL